MRLWLATTVSHLALKKKEKMKNQHYTKAHLRRTVNPDSGKLNTDFIIEDPPSAVLLILGWGEGTPKGYSLPNEHISIQSHILNTTSDPNQQPQQKWETICLLHFACEVCSMPWLFHYWISRQERESITAVMPLSTACWALNDSHDSCSKTGGC